MRRSLWLFALFVLSVPCQRVAAQARQEGGSREMRDTFPERAAARAAIDHAWDLVAERAKSSDATGMAALYAPDAMMIDTGIPTLSGRPAIEQAMRQLFTTSRFISMTHQQTSIEIDGDIAIENGIIAPTWQENGKEPVTTTERYTVIWKRVNGSWLLFRDVGTPMPPPASAPARD